MSNGAMTRRDVLAGAAVAAPLGSPAQRVANPASGLRRLADAKGFRFGAAIDSAALAIPELLDLYQRNCNSVTPRNALKWPATEAIPKRFTLDVQDKIVAFAEANRMAVYGHTLIWYRSPNWVSRLSDAAAVGRAMTRHITTLMTHYAGRINAWDVVNEALEYDTPDMRPSVFYRYKGEDYIREAFETAHAADPKATLVLNETHLEKAGDAYQQRRDFFLKLIDRLIGAKTPIHAVGLQSHFRPGLDALDERGMGAFCAALKARGIGVYITELDASLRFVKRVPRFSMDLCGAIFQSVIEVAAQSGNLLGATVWGLAEKYAGPESLKDPSGRKLVNLYDDDNQPRPTYFGIERALRNLGTLRPAAGA